MHDEGRCCLKRPVIIITVTENYLKKGMLIHFPCTLNVLQIWSVPKIETQAFITDNINGIETCQKIWKLQALKVWSSCMARYRDEAH